MLAALWRSSPAADEDRHEGERGRGHGERARHAQDIAVPPGPWEDAEGVLELQVRVREGVREASADGVLIRNADSMYSDSVKKTIKMDGHIQVVFNNKNRVTTIYQPLQNFKQLINVSKM